jgi:hypothetical protein
VGNQITTELPGAATLTHEQLQSQYLAELKKVLGSEAFRHSDSLRRLLEYIGEKTLAGCAGELKEYTIGLEAFNKSADYDPQLDATVRVLASKLRNRLREYYAKEGADSPVRIEIPKGHYELRFQVLVPIPAPQPAPLLQRVRTWQWISAGLAVCALVFLVLVMHWWPRGTENSLSLGADWTPELELIWQPFLESDHPTLISLGTPMFAKLSGTFFRNPGINQWSDASESDQLRLLQKDLGSEYIVPSYPYTGVGEAYGAFLLCKLLYARKPDLILQRNNALSWDELRVNNVVFLGSPKLNQQLKDIPVEGGFVIDGAAIRNQTPKPGEQNAYGNSWSDDHMKLLEDHALIYRLPGLYEHAEIMILSSSSTEGTWAAVEYVTKPIYARELVRRLQSPDGKLPPCFQIVVRAEFRQQIPWKISYVTHRVLTPPWKSRQ